MTKSESADEERQQLQRRRVVDWQKWVNLVILASVELLGGFTFSLLSPFYTKEAILKGVTVSETGVVYGSVFVTTIIFAPIFGKFIGNIGSRSLFLLGTFLAGSTNVLFGFLQWVDDRTTFLWLSLLVRFVTAVGEAAFFASVYPLAVQAVDESQRSRVLSVLETMFGIGLMIGPFFGGVLYEWHGFYLPFTVCGGAMIFFSLIGYLALKPPLTAEDSIGLKKNTTYWKLINLPGVVYSCFATCLAGISVAWYLPSLQPFLEDNFQLGTISIGALFMLDGFVYALFSPFWGWMLDRGFSPLTALFWGNMCVIIGYCLLGPAPFLQFILPKSIYLVAIALTIHGFGVAANLITTLTFIISHSVVAGGMEDNEQTRGMVTSLWFINECLGGYIGAAGGGYAYDNLGFENGSLIVIGLQLLAIGSLYFFRKIRQDEKRKKQKRELLQQQGSGAEINYNTIVAK